MTVRLFKGLKADGVL